MTVSVPIPETIYDCVLYQCSYGTLKLCEEQLSFHTDQKVSVLPWKKVVRRQVTSSSSNIAKPMFKLILKSGNEAVFQMEDRICLEVLRDDLGERLSRWRKLHPEPTESAAVNKTRERVSSKRQSTPYSMVSKTRLFEMDDHSLDSMPQSSTLSIPQQRRASHKGVGTRKTETHQRRANPKPDQSIRSAPGRDKSTRSAPGRMSETTSTATSRNSTTGPFSVQKGRRNAHRPLSRTLSGETAKRGNRCSVR